MLNRVSDENTAVYKGVERPVQASGAAVHVPTEAAARPHLLEDSPRSRSQYLALLEASEDATVYQTLEWLDIFLTGGAELRFVALGEEAMVPFVCKGSGPTRRAYSLPFDTYGGVVGTGGSVPVPFDTIIGALGIPSARVVDFAGRIETRGERENVTTHIVSLEGGYSEAAARYQDANRRLIRQAGERGVKIGLMRDEAELPAFHHLHELTVGRKGAQGFPLEFFRRVYRLLVPAGLATFYLARHGDDVVGGNLVLRRGTTAIDWMWVYDSTRSELRVTNALIDQAVRDEANRGSLSLNLGSSPEYRLGSIRFKQSFGARAYAYCIFSHRSRAHTTLRGLKRNALRLAGFLRGR